MFRTALMLSLGVFFLGCKTENQLAEAPAPDAWVRLTTPDAVAFLPAGNALVSGEFSEVTGLSVNGVTASTDASRFSAIVDLPRGITVLEGTGIDSEGTAHFERRAVMAGTYADERELVEEAVAVRISTEGLQTLFVAAGEVLDDELLAGILAEGPLFDDSLAILGWEVGSLTVNVLSLTFDRIDAQAASDGDTLALGLSIPNVALSVTAVGHAANTDFDLTTVIHTTALEVLGDVSMGTDNGALDITIDDVAVELGLVTVSPSITGNENADELILALLAGIGESVLEVVMTGAIPNLLEDRLSELAVGIEATVLETQLQINGEFAYAEVDGDGIELGVDLGVALPSSGYNGGPGYLRAPPESPTLDHAPQVAVAIADDVVNVALYQAWQAGLLDLDISTQDGSLPALALASLRADEGSLQVRTLMPPVLIERNGMLEVQAGGIDFSLHTPDGEFGTIVEASMALFIEADVLVRDGVLTLEFGEADMVIQVHSSDWGDTNEAISSMLEHLLPIDLITDFGSGLAVPLPGLAGVQVDQADVTRDASGSHTGVTLNLGQIPE